jgi:hypothetical protein
MILWEAKGKKRPAKMKIVQRASPKAILARLICFPSLMEKHIAPELRHMMTM